MIKKTNLKNVREIALAFLYFDIEPILIDGIDTGMIRHPFFSTNFYPYENKSNSEGLKLLDLNDTDNLSIARKHIKEMIQNNFDSFISILAFVSKPYRSAFFKYCKEFLDIEDFSSGLRVIWVNTEFPNKDVNVSLNEFKSYYKKADRNILMDSDEIEKLNNLPDKDIIVYRGTRTPYYNALSWTLSKDIANRFATRFSQKGVVYTAKIDKKDIYAYFDGEDEIVLDYKKLKNIKKL